MHASIDRHLADLARTLEKTRASIRSVILRCRHLHVAEIPSSRQGYTSEDFAYSSPSWHLCLACGLAEEGWSTMYHLPEVTAPLPQKYRILCRISRSNKSKDFKIQAKDINV